MSHYTIGALVSFILFGMGMSALIMGGRNYQENRESRSGYLMFNICWCVFFWDVGYAWMGLCYNEGFAYVARAVALLAVTLYMTNILWYVTELSGYPRRRLAVYLVLFIVTSLVAWLKIIGKDAVDFMVTPWGYWYTSKMSWGRILQFVSVITALVQYYFILYYWRKKTDLARQRFIIGRFKWFGVILFIGYMFDTLFPTVLHIPALPGSSIAAFFSAMLLYSISKSYRAFGLSKSNIAEYVFQDVSTPVLILNRNEEIVLYNNITKSYLGIPDPELKNRKANEIFTRYLGVYEQDVELVMNSPEVYDGLKDAGDDLRFVRTRKTDKMCKVAKTIVRDQFGDVMYTICFLQDMTNEREIMKNLKDSRAAAEEANRAKSNFLANMSHEIRTPMNAIIGMSEILMQNTELPEKIQEQVQEIQTAGISLLGIINDILDISKIEAGKYELIDDEYELPVLLHEVSSIIRVRVQETGIRYILQVEGTLPQKLIGDAKRVRQILLNILGNAVKFTREGSITCSVDWNHDTANPQLYFEISDTGIGIKKEDLQNIFNAFSQVDTRKNRNVQGTGLGLAISKHLAELMGGSIDVQSVYGEGSKFTICINQRIQHYVMLGDSLREALQNHQFISSAINKELEIIPRPDAKVLIVDDTGVNLMVAKGLMKKYQMQIDTAKSGKEAIEKVQQKDYDLVFMDHMMPEMDGVDAAKAIRALDGGKYAGLTIVALTANAVGDAKEMFIREGMQDFLAKPIEKRALDDILNKWLPVNRDKIR